MWVQTPKYLMEGKDYSVLDEQLFVHPAVYINGVYINRVTKEPIKNAIRVWD
jgi:hypothetical protein